MSSPLSFDAQAKRGFDAVFAAIVAEDRRREAQRQRVIDRLKGKAQ